MLNFEKIDEKIIKRNRLKISFQQEQKTSTKNDSITSKFRQSKECFSNTNTHRKCEINKFLIFYTIAEFQKSTHRRVSVIIKDKQ